MKPSSIDYLTSDAEPQSKQSRGTVGQSVNALVDRAASLWGGQILGKLRKTPTGELQAFDLVDATSGVVPRLSGGEAQPRASCGGVGAGAL